MKPNPFLEVIVRSFLIVQERCFNALINPAPLSIRKPAFLRCELSCGDWPREHCASEPFGFLNRASSALAAFALLLFVTVAAAAVRDVDSIELTVNDLSRELNFFTNTLPFQTVSFSQSERGAADQLLGLSGTELRSVELQLGRERIRLTEHLSEKGRPIPPDSRSFDHWFQHIAIVVGDMDRAYAQLRDHKVRHVSTAPQTLPAWNRDAGGIKAFYFRDPEDHVLEIIWFPPGKGDPRWQSARLSNPSPLFLGIDHTAIVVSDTDRSLTFYTNVLGMRVVGSAENYGVEQEHLNQVFGARVRITALRAERGPGIEFLEYITPPGGRPLPRDAKANDLFFWQTRLRADGLRTLEGNLHRSGVQFVSAEDNSEQCVVRDPDGHALRLVATPTSTNAFARATGNR